jgi:hypothetical protein
MRPSVWRLGTAAVILWLATVSMGANTWTPKYLPGRASHAMAFDQARGEVVLFGGWEGSTLNDTWVWNGSNWTQRNPANKPPGNWDLAITFDAFHGEAVLVFASSFPGSCQTWIWDGTDWTPLFYFMGTSPSAQRDHAMTYDVAHKKVIMFGGENNNANIDETWTWDFGWTLLAPDQKPSARLGSAIAYDVTHDETVLFGGLLAAMNDTWTLNLGRLVYLPLILH